MDAHSYDYTDSGASDCNAGAYGNAYTDALTAHRDTYTSPADRDARAGSHSTARHG